jgi:hypothetical protein
MIRRLRLLAPLVILLFAGAATSQPTSPTAAPDAAKVEFFEKKVRPILADHCYHCHSADTKPAGGLRVDDRNGLVTGGNKGPAIVPGSPESRVCSSRASRRRTRRSGCRWKVNT